MKVKVKSCELEINSDIVNIKTDRVLENCIFKIDNEKKNEDGTITVTMIHDVVVNMPLYHIEKIPFKKIKDLYFLTFEKGDRIGCHITPNNFYQKQKLLWMYGKHWFQDKNNIMWIVNVVVAILAIIAALAAIK